MRAWLRAAILAVCYYSGLTRLVRWWTRRSGRSLIILYYHRATGEQLRNQWLYLRRHYRILHLKDALEELYLSSNKTLYQQDQRTMLALTFDDGYADNYTHAFALASDLHIPMTIFLVPGYIDCADSFWWADRLVHLARVDQVSFEGHSYHLDQQEACKALAQIISQQINAAQSLAEREAVLLTFSEILAVPSSEWPKEEPAPLLTWAQIREMEQSGWVSFGAHTVHHPDLERLTNPIEVQNEVEACHAMLEQQLEQTIDTFAYPYGHIGDYGLQAVQQAGYKWAVTTESGLNRQQSNPHLLQRRNADAGREVWLMAAEVVGIWSFFMHLKKSVGFFKHSLHRRNNGARRNDSLQTTQEKIII